MRKLILTMTLALIASTNVHAAQRGGLCFGYGHSINKNTDPFACPFLGDVTIDQIYEKGFRVVQIFLLVPKDRLSPFGVVIEEQRP
jgi:hypothetical protein